MEEDPFGSSKLGAVSPLRLELLAVLLIILALGLHVLAWQAPPRLDRKGYVELLIEAGRRGSTPWEVALAHGYLESELGRAAWAYGDVESERRIAERLGKNKAASQSRAQK
jgi:hypothetical protein